jgi:secondary thiamine-phosphate synthase enzyme
MLLAQESRAGLAVRVASDTIVVRTTECLQFVDVTDAVAEQVRALGLRNGIVNLQIRHTTASLIVNENEPLLLQDLRDALERAAPRALAYRHDDFGIRTVNLQPDEPPNGHSHCKALFLPASQTVNVVDGALQLGRWQRLFLVELDGGRERTVSLVALGS